MHNTYYNNMVCYINNKQSDTDSHQSKVNNHNNQSDNEIFIWLLGERENGIKS